MRNYAVISDIASHCIGEVITVYPVEYEAQSDIRYNGVISHDGNIEYR